MSVNKCIFLGHVGKDPEVKTVGDNKVATFSMAMTDKGYTTRDGKEIPDRTEWVNIVAWRGLASICEGYVKKGSMLYVEGRLTTRSYEKDGTKFYVTEVVAENLQLCGGKQEGASQGSKGSSAGSKPEQYASAPQTDDDLPF
jgi:single-strand DNA-binding protein